VVNVSDASITLHVNGRPHPVEVDPETPLIQVLRQDLALMGVRPGCSIGVCGACTVIADGVPIPVLGVVLGIIVGAVINLLAVTIKIIAYTMQPLRLHYVEFFSKFGFHDESGRPYRPFRLLGGKS
jgi:aerobic-type carbon monoxide dehydrogenase small subunit (CoxS/CutS family)